MIYRIYTEDVNREHIEFLAGTFFNGFTIIEATGYWKGEREKSLVIEIVTAGTTPKENDHKVEQLAKQIKTLNRQESVLVTSQPIDSILI